MISIVEINDFRSFLPLSLSLSLFSLFRPLLSFLFSFFLFSLASPSHALLAQCVEEEWIAAALCSRRFSILGSRFSSILDSVFPGPSKVAFHANLEVSAVCLLFLSFSPFNLPLLFLLCLFLLLLFFSPVYVTVTFLNKKKKRRV